LTNEVLLPLGLKLRKKETTLGCCVFFWFAFGSLLLPMPMGCMDLTIHYLFTPFALEIKKETTPTQDASIGNELSGSGESEIELSGSEDDDDETRQHARIVAQLS
jgi:hypothetical protein